MLFIIVGITGLVKTAVVPASMNTLQISSNEFPVTPMIGKMYPKSRICAAFCSRR